MTWSEVCEHSALRDAPFKVETNEWGQVLMSPATNKHYFAQYRVARLLEEHAAGGVVFTECAVETGQGTRVTDAAWISEDRCRPQIDLPAFRAAPEICVEIDSPGNSDGEFALKAGLYFKAGAEEVWRVDAGGRVRFFAPGRPIGRSLRCPAFPDFIQHLTGKS